MRFFPLLAEASSFSFLLYSLQANIAHRRRAWAGHSLDIRTPKVGVACVLRRGRLVAREFVFEGKGNLLYVIWPRFFCCNSVINSELCVASAGN